MGIVNNTTEQYYIALIGVIGTCSLILTSVLCIYIRRCCLGQGDESDKLVNQTKKFRRKKITIGLLTEKLNDKSLQTIPFTVPPSTPPINRRDLRRGKSHLDEVEGANSAPTSPCLAKRPSVEIPGAYTLGTIDPTLYKVIDEDDRTEYAPENIGRIWFALEYEAETEKLLVTLMKARNLPNRGLGGCNACDPFVRLFLMPDERRYLQSKPKKKTCNPKFEESYVFQASKTSLEERYLKLTVYDIDRHKRHNVIGHALYFLKPLYECGQRIVLWRDLERDVTDTSSNFGELHLSLCYNEHLDRITIGVFEFKKTDTSIPTDSHVKVCLLHQNKILKTKKTETIRKSDDVLFNESFTFKVPQELIDTSSINISVMQHPAAQKGKSAGRIVLGPFMFSRGKELEHWNEMMARPREQINYWHSIS